MGVVVIGVDAHKHSHTLVAVDEVGRRRTVPGDDDARALAREGERGGLVDGR